jgi:hypothetical protein
LQIYERDIRDKKRLLQWYDYFCIGGYFIGLEVNLLICFFHSSSHPTGAFACERGYEGCNITVHEYSCNGRASCRMTSGRANILSGSCNFDWACQILWGTATIGENSCGAEAACERVTGNLQISNNSCNGQTGEICFELTLFKVVLLHTNLLFLFRLFRTQACSNRWSGNLTVQEYSCNSYFSCRGQLSDLSIGPSSVYIGKHSCNGESNDNRHNTITGTGTGHPCHPHIYISSIPLSFPSSGDVACHAPGEYVMVQDNACNNNAACTQLSQTKGSVAKIANGSCNNLWQVPSL